MNKGPLEGIKVVDWTIWQFGPVSTMMLGDMGADVIKLESREGDPGRGMGSFSRVSGGLAGGRTAYFEGNNRNKKSITLDLTKPEAREIVYKLVAQADVFVQNFRKGVAERLGLSYETLKQHNPRIIYASASAFGAEGPDAGLPGFDTAGQARGGMMYAAIPPGADPRAVGGGVADQIGGITLCLGILGALVARNQHGIGQKLDVSHLGSVIWLQGLAVSMGMLNKRFAPPTERTNAANPLSNSYKCKDDNWIQFVNLQSDRYWPTFCRLLGLEHLVEDPKFSTMQARSQNAHDLIALFDQAFATKTRDEWFQLIPQAGDLIYAPVQRLTDLENDPQVIANQYIAEAEHPVLGPIKLANHPVRYSETPTRIRSTAPELGEHTEDVLLGLGYTWEQIAELHEKGAI